MRVRKRIGDLNHLVSVCSAKDVVDENGTMCIRKDLAFETWAKVEADKGSFFSTLGDAIKESRDKETHCIYIRYRCEIEISSAAWIYEQRLQSSPRWYKILSVEDCGEESRYWKFKCRLVERSDDVVRPVETEPEQPQTGLKSVPLPEGVRL